MFHSFNVSNSIPALKIEIVKKNECACVLVFNDNWLSDMKTASYYNELHFYYIEVSHGQWFPHTGTVFVFSCTNNM